MTIFLLSKNRSKNDFWLWGPREPGWNEFLKIFNLFHLSYALTTIFIIKVSFPANTDILTYENDIYSVSCDLSAAPAPGQSAGSGTRPVLIETKRSNTGTEKYSSWPFLGRYWLVLFSQCKSCAGTGTLSWCRCRWKIARNAVLYNLIFVLCNLEIFSILKLKLFVVFLIWHNLE